MIKQSRNAVTMLLSCFKGIYQSAYVKGIASAVVLTAGLAAGAANAADITGAANGSEWVISSNATVNETTGITNIPATVTTVKVTGAAGVVTVSPSSSTAYDVDRAFDLVVEKGAQYTVSGSNSAAASENWKNISVAVGTVTIGGSGTNTSALGTTAEGKIILNSAESTAAKVVLDATGADVTLGTASKSAITLDGNALIEIKGTNSGSVAGASFTMEDTLTTKTSATPSVSVADGAKGAISVKDFTMEGGYIKNLGTLSIGDTGSTITITGGTIENGTAAADVITFKSDVTLGKGVTVLNNNSGKIAFDGDATVDASLFKDGALWKADTAGLTLATGKTLTVESDSAVDLVAVGFVETDGTVDVATATGAATVAMDAATLTNAVFAGGNIGLEVGQLTVSGSTGVFTIGGSSATGNITVLDSLSMTSKDASGDKTLKVGASGQVGTLTLGEAKSVAAGTLNDIDLEVASETGSAISVVGGNWTGNDVTVTAGSFNVTGGSFTGADLDVATGATGSSVASGASATFKSVNVAKANGLTISGTLTVEGDGDPLQDEDKPFDEKDNPYLKTVNLTSAADGNIAIATGGELVIADVKDVLQLKYASSAFSVDGTGFYKIANNGTLTLNGLSSVLGGVTALNQAQLTSLKSTLTTGNGIIDIDSVNIDFTNATKNDKGEYNYSTVSFANGFTNDQTEDMKVNVTTADNTTGVAGNWASFNTQENLTSFNIAGTTTVYGDELGNLAVKHTASGDEILGFNFNGDHSLTLEGSGKVGAITATTSGHGTLTVENNIQVTDAKGEKLAAIGADKELKEVIVNGSLQASGINTYELTVKGGTIDMATANGAQNIVLGGATAPSSVSTESVIDGGYVTADTLQLLAAAGGQTNDLNVYGGSTVVVDTFTAAGATNTIRVGRDADEDAGIASSTGSFYAGTLTLAGATLEIDPEYSNQVAVVAADKLSTGSTADGSYEIGKNAALGVGFESLAEFRTEALNKFTNASGALNRDNIGSLIYLNKAVTLGSAAGIAMNADGTPGTVVDGENPYGAAATAHNITLGANTALVLSRDAFFDGGAANAALTFDGTSQDTLSLDVNSKVILDGIFTAQDTGMTLIQAGSSNGITLNFTDGVDTPATNGSVEVQVGNGVITAGSISGTSISASGTHDLTFAIDDDRLNALNASAAAKELVRDSFEDYTAEEIDDNAGLSFVYLAGTGYGQDGSAIDAAANLAVFGGAAQTALMASQTTTDVISARMGVGNVNSALMYADNANGAGIWLAPVYKNHDSDSFDANGVDYGADIDLTGVAFGADFTTEEGLRFGAMFNIGTGDADGQGAASAVSNDFDYYALGLYAGASFDQFSLVGDLTYAQSSNDIEMNSIIGKMDADTDVSALSFGLTGQYEFSTEVLDILPHVGVRFTQLEMDPYDVKVGGDAVAASDSDTMNIVSIPVGVTFAKEIAAGEWYVKPALDLAVTMNTGDNELDTDTSFGPMSMEPVSAEVIDDVTYSVGLGLSAKYNALSLGLGVNYVGSDNADELGVNGMARYSF